VSPLGLAGEAVPAEARAVIDETRKLEAFDVRINELRRRIQGIDQDSARFDERVSMLVKELDPSLTKRHSFEAAAGLYHALREAQRSADSRERLNTRLAELEEWYAEASRAVSRCRAKIRAMCDEAGCETPEQMPERIKGSEQRARIEQELEQVEEQMRHLSGGMELADFVAELESVDSDSIVAALEEVESSAKDLDRERSELDQVIGSERHILSTMDGSPKAAMLAQDAEDLAAKIERKVAQYVRLRLAWTVLNRAVESYREKNQGPILTRSGELFCELTRGAFAGLRVEYDRKDIPVLVGVRPDSNAFVHVENMSDGTRDQLYLAIRLASLATYVERKGPMPFLVDDVLVNFDDDRSLAALKVLARLSDATQIVFFTHHRHLVDMAETALPENKLFVHELTA
ncbi:MAG: ATP-binding protein, partial [Desulfovibrionales bacterium]